MKYEADQLDDCQAGNAGSSTLKLLRFSLTALSTVLTKFRSDLENYKTNITALVDWMLSAMKQPLELDYLYLAALTYEQPKAEAGLSRKACMKSERLRDRFFKIRFHGRQRGSKALH